MTNADLMLELYGDQAYEEAIAATVEATNKGEISLAAEFASAARDLLRRGLRKKKARE